MTALESENSGRFLLNFYRFLTRLAAPFLPGHLKRRVDRGKEDPSRLEERWGRHDRPRPDGALIWFHGASVGESLSILPLIEAIRRQYGDLAILVTTGTVTSAKLMAERLPDGCQHAYVPLDLTDSVSRFLDHWRPDLALLVESELWPNLILLTHAKRCPLILLNGRMSERSHRTWSRLAPLAGRLLASFSLVLAQSEQDAARFMELGCRNCRYLGNLKFSAPPLACDNEELTRLEGRLAARPLWLAASTHPGEEAIVAKAHQLLKRDYPDLLTLLVPRHPQRGPGLSQELIAMGLKVARRAAGEDIAPETDVYLADSIGEMGLWYRLSDIVLMGGSLVPKGGQNFLEPAKLSCTLISGPHRQNFQVIADGLEAASGLTQVENAEELAAAIGKYLRDDAARRASIEASAAYAVREEQVLSRILSALHPLLTQAANAKPNS